MKKILKTFFFLNVKFLEEWDMLSKPIKAHGDMLITRIICMKLLPFLFVSANAGLKESMPP